MKPKTKRQVISGLVNVLEDILEYHGNAISHRHQNEANKMIRHAIRYQQSPEGQKED